MHLGADGGGNSRVGGNSAVGGGGNSGGCQQLGGGGLQPLRTALHTISMSPKQFELKQS